MGAAISRIITSIGNGISAVVSAIVGGITTVFRAIGNIIISKYCRRCGYTLRNLAESACCAVLMPALLLAVIQAIKNFLVAVFTCGRGGRSAKTTAV